MNKKERNLFKLQEFKKLKDDWNGYGAEAFNHTLIDISIDVISKFTIQPEVFPTARNSIQFEYKKINGDYLEFELYLDKVELFIQTDFEELEKEYTYETIDWNVIVNDFINE